MFKGMPSILCILALSTHTSLAEEAPMRLSLFSSNSAYTDILPIKQLVTDDWLHAPNDNASLGFSQNEAGIRGYWGRVSMSISRRYDYFVNVSPDTAQALYRERQGLPLNEQTAYQVSLDLRGQSSSGIRLGYALELGNVYTEVRAGYWQLDSRRASSLEGRLSADVAGNLIGQVALTEAYSDNNLLRRPNNGSWNTQGQGLTLDIIADWQVTSTFALSLHMFDLYSDFKVNNLGFSQGVFDTEGEFINSTGGIAFTPLYRGVETSEDHQFRLPQRVQLEGLYELGKTGVMARVRKQGNHYFQQLGAKRAFGEASMSLLVDLDSFAPEVTYSNAWLSFTLQLDDWDISQAQQGVLSMTVSHQF
jgi:hypothetical protein